MIKWLARVSGYEEKVRREEIERAETIKKDTLFKAQQRADKELLEAKKQGEAAAAQKLFDEINKITSRPTERDIKLLESLVTRGVAQVDIESLLGITSKEFEKWKENIEVDRIVKLKAPHNPEKYTMNHPDLEGQTELAFEAGLKKFYRFKDDFRMPTGRYKYVYKRFKEHDLRMTRETLIQYLDLLEKYLSGGEKGKAINLFQISRTVYDMRTWTKLPFEPGAIKRLAAVIFFTEDEDLSTFNEKEGQAKIDWWEANDVHDFFSTAPIGDLLNLSATYNASLQESLSEMQEIVKALTSDLSEKLQES